MPTRDDLLRWDREIVWHAFTQMAEYKPLILEHGRGCTVVDIDGREYLDATSSLWCNLHGHRHPQLDAAIVEQLACVAHVTNLGMSNPTTIELAKRLVDLAPPGLKHVFFSDDGATAVEVALKMAFQYWRQRPNPRPEKTLYVALGDAYHGDSLGSVSVGGVERFQTMFKPLLFEVIRVPMPKMYRLPPGVTSETALAHYLGQMERVLMEQHQQIAAVVLEPLVQCAAGIITHPAGYLRGVRELCTKYNVLLIADEVAVGFGRTGQMFACEHEQVTPDFLCLAKGLTAGYMPLAATLTTDEIWRAFLGTYAESRSFFHGHTYGGNPLGAAVALANLRVFQEEQTLTNMQPKVVRLAEHLARLSRHPKVGDVRQCGLIAGVELVREKATKEPYPWEERRGWQVCEAALAEGVLIRPLGNVVVIMPPLAIRLDELDRICAAVGRGIEATLSN
ncbi:MAG TPA: adenosylmethionine--8-amino-7-oxononanoate transaminase [Pirellulales bacterium]|jgi:adenosylmethionine-8-amino-7-oxononanoate aminotransferase|nr:adenosylmethionine--8-amino-7-oxononanoate transaminase [Pirellulales bacterium]